MEDMLIECDSCNRVFCGPGVLRVVFRVGNRILCDDCVAASKAPPLVTSQRVADSATAKRRTRKKKVVDV